MALYSNTLVDIRHYISSVIGDLLHGQCGEDGEDTTNINAPFLWQPNNYYKDHKYEVYVYDGQNVGETRRVTGWDLVTKLLTVHSEYEAACGDTSFIELHYIFTVDELLKAINLSIEALAGKYLIDISDETSITLEEDVYEYELPLNFMYLHQVTKEDKVDSGEFYESGIIDPRSWDVLKSYPPKLKLNKFYCYIEEDKDLRLEGQGAQATVSDDTDIINLPPDWLIQKAITFLPQAKIQSNKLDNIYRQALALSAREPMRHPHPYGRRLVD